MEPEMITCIEVVHPNGEHVFEPMVDYLRNPAPGTWVLSASRKLPAEVIERSLRGVVNA